MSDEVVIGKGVVASIAGSYGQDMTLDVNRVTSYIQFGGNLNDKIAFTKSYDGQDRLLGMTFPGKLEFGEEYEIIARRVKKNVPEVGQPSGPRMFKEESE